jgi:tRNA(fMet)-specific endonuclease VapC
MYLLDTDTLSHHWANNANVESNILRIEDSEIGITSITKAEVLRVRCENLLKAESSQHLLLAQLRFDRSERLLEELLVAPFDEIAADKFAALLKHGKLKRIGRADLLIASSVLAHDATLVTRNLRHFRQIPALKVENWVD